MSRRYFGTDGVRGPYGGPVINEAFAEKLGVAAGRFFSRSTRNRPLRAMLGRDTRASGESLMQAVASGLASVGIECVLLDVVPTPAVSVAVIHEHAALGVVITASHNPASDNGIKFFGGDGLKLSDAQELEIERLLPDEAPTLVSLMIRRGNALETYLNRVRPLLAPDALRGWKIVVDTANGATCTTTPNLLRGWGADVIAIGGAPDGNNINLGLGSEHPEKLRETVIANGARLGVAHDGDGDRVIFCDERGKLVDGDEILTLLALDALKRRQLGANTLVVTVQSNLGVDAALRAAGGQVRRTPVGDRYVIEAMRASGSNLGGESSGHIICSDVTPTGDGLVAAARLLHVMLATSEPLSQLRTALKKFPQATLNLRVREKRELAQLPHFPIAVQALERELGDRGRVLARYSGTEAKLRLLVEGPTDAVVHDGLRRLEKVARTDLDVTD